ALLIVVGVVLLVACANIASLQIGRGAARGHELSVRLALGASRRQLAQQLFVESVVLAAAGTLAGFVFAGWASRAIVAQMSSSAVPVVIDLSADWRVLGFTSSVMVIAVLLFGTAPAVRATRVAPIDALKAHGRTVGGAGRWLSMIVVAQVALSLILVVGAGLFVSTFEQLARVSLGFEDRDTVGSPPVMWVNDAVAGQQFPGQRLVGTPLQLTFRSQEFGDIPIGVKTVVGIVENTVFRSIRSPAQPAYYAPLAQRSDPMLWTYFYITVRAKAGSPALLTSRLTATLHAINPDLTLTFRPIDDQVNESLAQDRLVAMLSAFFGGLALLLAALGLYGVTAHAVAQAAAG